MKGGEDVKRIKRGFLMALLLLVGWTVTAYSAIPPDQINFQGVLRDNSDDQ